MLLYRTPNGPVVVNYQTAYLLPTESWDSLINRDDLAGHLRGAIGKVRPLFGFSPAQAKIQPPIAAGQEVWAAGVTYYRSRDARMEESEKSGGGSFYDKVYSAARPELFFKASPSRVVGPNAPVRIRSDSKWNVPEPELTLVITSSGRIIGYTIGNDMSSRDIEGENPLYLPQAKVYDGCCGLGPCVLVSEKPLEKTTQIKLSISRGGASCFEGATTLAELKRDPKELVEYLYRETTFPQGCLLMTGTGIVPASPFTLEVGDIISISIDGIGTLTNSVESRVPSPSPREGRGPG